jgi:hypothetical protein
MTISSLTRLKDKTSALFKSTAGKDTTMLTSPTESQSLNTSPSSAPSTTSPSKDYLSPSEYFKQVSQQYTKLQEAALSAAEPGILEMSKPLENINPSSDTSPIYFQYRYALYGNGAPCLIQDDSAYPFPEETTQEFLIEEHIKKLQPGQTLKVAGYQANMGMVYKTKAEVPKLPEISDPVGSIGGYVSSPKKFTYPIAEPPSIIDKKDLLGMPAGASQKIYLKKNLGVSTTFADGLTAGQAATLIKKHLDSYGGNGVTLNSASSPSNFYGTGLAGLVGGAAGYNGLGKTLEKVTNYTPTVAKGKSGHYSAEDIKAIKAGKFDYMLDKSDAIPVELQIVETPTGRKFRDEEE